MPFDKINYSNSKEYLQYKLWRSYDVTSEYKTVNLLTNDKKDSNLLF